MISSLLVANRGEIACRVIRAAQKLGIRTVAVFSDADQNAAHVQLADSAIRIGPAEPKESYLRGDLIIAAAKSAGADAIHPGYGFLSENADFAEACEAADIIFVGPPPTAIRAMGLKGAAKTIMEKAGVPVVPGYHGPNQDADFLTNEAQRIGFPVLIKAVAGGGGKGMRRVDSADTFAEALASAQREAANAFGNDRVLIEKYVLQPRHIEIQVFTDAHGNAVHLHERDCSIQRRHQKVLEEAPACGMSPEMRALMGRAAVAAAQAVGYRGAGTVEFIADASQGLRPDSFFFMEMNTRLQVEHPVTEMITGQDLVAWQLEVAAGGRLPLSQNEIPLNGHAIEVRLCAEDPENNFLPAIGQLARYVTPENDTHTRVDTGVREGDWVTQHYDSMIAKLIVWDSSRSGAIRRLRSALGKVRIAGVQTNLDLLRDIAANSAFVAGDVDTAFIERHSDTLLPEHRATPDGVFAIAALDRLLPKTGATPPPATDDLWSPWHANDGWRLGSVRQHHLLSFATSEGVITVEAAYSGTPDHPTYSLTLPGSSMIVSARREGEHEIVSLTPRGRLSASVHRTDSHLLIMTEERTYKLGYVDGNGGENADENATGDITAAMPGRIISVTVKVGTPVRRGETLVVLEAMKMEQNILAPADAIVESILVDVGDQVTAGTRLVTLT
ncbi:acetyl/propionyl/methylcrotonyl-CoA carboxylase subunit alpha [Parvibaculum sp.]|uniref:acetyl/propionyl/methylcrotonyl-CoA carboxylase subunit alpha n=1 Tax=Parvibaculum sp. TaxID=2024848 RepID=UPI003C777DED